MVLNVTYDPCELLPLQATSIELIILLIMISLAGSLDWYDSALNKEVVYSPGDIAWVLASTALVWIMIPGVGFFYSGLLRCARLASLNVFFFLINPPPPFFPHI